MASNQLTSDKWGFSVATDNPFAIFSLLQKIAQENAETVIDLSRGDPGYGFTPSVRGRKFFSYLILLDSYLNHDRRRFVDFAENQYEEILADIVDFTGYSYSKVAADDLIRDLEFFIDSVIEAAGECGLTWSRFDVLKRIFSYCPVSGGSYLNPQGEEITRVVLAGRYKKFIETPFDHNDLILFNGASHAIGSLFKALGKSGIDYLNADGVVVICSPAYAPYLRSLDNLGIRSFSLSVNPLNGKIPGESLDHLEELKENVKAIILIDPNNPTGFSLEAETLERIAKIAKDKDCMIISDEVYTSFFPKKKTIVDYAPERTLRIDARSKIERSTGLRFGDLLIPEAANRYLTDNVLKECIGPGRDLKGLLMQAKGPGGVEGEFKHTTFVPGPSQFLGICHMIMGESERKEYFESVKENSAIFLKELGLGERANLYYSIFDLNEIEGCKKTDVPVEEKLTELAKRGVVYLPVYLFFSELERKETASLNMVRASVVNTNAVNVKKAAQITKKYLTS